MAEPVDFRDFLPPSPNTDDLALRENLGVEENDFATNALREGATRFDANLDYFGAATREIFGDRPGAKAAADLAKSKEGLAEVYRNANGIKNFETLLEDGSVEDWGRYLVHTGLNAAPEIGLTISSAVVSGGTLPLLIQGGGRAVLKNKAKDIVKDKYVKRASQIAGGFAVNYPQRAGETFGFTGEAGASLVSGAPQAALDLFAEIAFLRAFGKVATGSAKGQAKSALQQITSRALQQGAIEGATEELQTELQLLTKKYADPDFDFTGDAANMMRLEAAVAGFALGTGIGGTGATVATTANKAREATQNFVDGARVPETDFIPETKPRLDTQLLELKEGRGREAVVKTDGPLSPQDLQEQGLQQVELADGQGVLIVREDQDINEIKEAFESGSRDVLGNGTVNKPEGGTEVVRSVNADGSRGADVVVTPDTEQAVTTAQEAKSDVGQTEKITAEQAVNERLNTVDDQIQFEDETNTNNIRGVNFEEAAAFNVTEEPTTTYGSNLREDGAGYKSRETAEQGVERLVKLRVDNERYGSREELTAEQVQEIEESARDQIDIQERDGEFFINEYKDRRADAIPTLVAKASGSRETNIGGKRQRVRHAAAVQKEVNDFLRSGEVKKLTGDLRKAFQQVIGMKNPNGTVTVLDLKTLAEEGWRRVKARGDAPANLTNAQRQMVGLQESLGELALAGFDFVQDGELGDLDLSLSPRKRIGRGEGSVQIGSRMSQLNESNRGPSLGEPPQRKDYKSGAAFFSAARKYILRQREQDANYELAPEGGEVGAMLEQAEQAGETRRAVGGGVEGLQADSEIADAARAGSRKWRSFGSPGMVATQITPNVKAVFGGKFKYLQQAVKTLSAALKLSDTNILVVDSEGVRKLLADENLDQDVRVQLQRAIDMGSAGKSMYPADKDFGIVYINTDGLTSRFPNYSNDQLRATAAWILMHEMGHQYFRKEVAAFSEADRTALTEVFANDETRAWYESKYEGNPDLQFNEWFADRVAAYGMRQFEGQQGGHLTGNRIADAAIKRVFDTLQKIYNVWRNQFMAGDAPIKSNYAESVMFNNWLDEVLNRGDMTAEEYAASPINEALDEAEARFEQFGEESAQPRNRASWRRTMKEFERAGVGSLLGRLFFSAHAQMSQLGTPGRRLARMMYKLSSTSGRDGFLQRALYEHQRRTGYLYKILPRDREAMTQVLDAYAVWRENGSDLNNIPEDIRPYHARLTAFFDAMATYLEDADPNFKRRDNYFMHLYDPEKLVDPRVQQALAQLLVRKQGMTEQEAARAVEGLRANLMRMNQSPNPEEVAAHSAQNREWTELTYAELRELGVLYDPSTAVFKYIRETTRAAEYNKVFGGQYNGQYRADAKVREELDRMSPDERAQAEKLMDGMLGRLGSKIDPKFAQVQSWLMTVQFMATLTFATLASLPDIMMPALRSREFSGLGENVRQIVRMMSDSNQRQAMYEEAQTLGVIANDVINDAIVAGYGSEWMSPGSRKVTDAFFKIIGLEHWTRMTRVVASSFGREFLIKHAATPNQRSARYLQELGIDGDTVNAWINTGYDYDSPPGREVQRAILRFTEESILRPNSAERPTYMSDPRFMLFAQLKGFYYSFGQKVVGGMYREMQSRRQAGEPIAAAMSPMILAGVALMPLAAMALALREEIKYDEGMAPTDRMDPGEYMMELVSRAGFLGPLEIPLSMFNASDYGQPFWVAPLGPAVGTGYDLIADGPIDTLEELIPIYNQFN